MKLNSGPFHGGHAERMAWLAEMRSFEELLSSITQGLAERAMQELREELESRITHELRAMEPELRRWYNTERCTETLQFILHPRSTT